MKVDTNSVMQSMFILTLVTLVSSQFEISKLPAVIIKQTTEMDEYSCPSASLLEEARNTLSSNISVLLQDTILPTYFAGRTAAYPATSCKNIRQDFPSGNYWIQTPSTGDVSMQYCDQSQRCNCNSTGGWMRVTNLDMSDNTQQCPGGFVFLDTPRRSCGKPTTGCTSAVFPAFGVEYSKVCGRVNAYQIGTTDAFINEDDTIDEPYVDGVSLTYNNTNSREHIWTFASAHDDTDDAVSVLHTCPCIRSDLTFSGSMPPAFVGQDYFCETGSHSQTAVGNMSYPDDLLWDGQGCGAMSTCCSFNNPPWFCKQLPQPTTSDIEMRLCHTAASENSPFELVEIYVQ